MVGRDRRGSLVFAVVALVLSVIALVLAVVSAAGGGWRLR